MCLGFCGCCVTLRERLCVLGVFVDGRIEDVTQGAREGYTR